MATPTTRSVVFTVLAATGTAVISTTRDRVGLVRVTRTGSAAKHAADGLRFTCVSHMHMSEKELRRLKKNGHTLGKSGMCQHNDTLVQTLCDGITDKAKRKRLLACASRHVSGWIYAIRDVDYDAAALGTFGACGGGECWVG